MPIEPQKILFIASNNAHKISEIRAILPPATFAQVKAASDANPSGNGVSWDETGSTFLANARIKIAALRLWTSEALLADDSGLEVDALGGAPGVWSSSYAGKEGDSEANNSKLINMLRDVSPSQRQARFRCCLVYSSAPGAEVVFEGSCEGSIGMNTRGGFGFGYDPLFEIPELGKTMAELTPEEKNATSHRAKALAAFMAYLASSKLPLWLLNTALGILFGMATPGIASMGVPLTHCGSATIERFSPADTYNYPIVIRGAKELTGLTVDKFVGLAKRGDRWRQIPIQIDEVNKQNEYVLEEGMPFTANSGNSIYDGNDELVFEGSAAGDNFTDSELPAHVAKLLAHTWRLILCRNNHFAGAILLASLHKPLPTNDIPGIPAAEVNKAVSYDQERNIVNTDLYRYEFSADNPVLLGQVMLKQNTKNFPIFESSRFKMPLVTPWLLPDITLSNENFKSLVECWRRGPVRTIIAVGVKFKNFLSVLNLHMFSELIFYRNMFQIPTVIQFTFEPGRFLQPGSGLFYAISFPPDRQWPLTTNLPNLPLESAAQLIARGETAAKIETFFARSSRPEGSFMVKVRVDPKARSMVPPPYLIAPDMFKDQQRIKRWPWLAGESADLGVFLDISQVKSGTYDFGLDLVLSPEADHDFTDFGTATVIWNPFVAFVAGGTPPKAKN